MLPANIRTWDRVLRVAVATGMLIVGWQLEDGWATALRIFAFFPLFTGLTGWCPLYALFGFGRKRR